MRIEVKSVINSPIAAFHNDGLLVYNLLEDSFKKKEPIELSFIGIDRCATQFLNASIGKMYLEHDPSILESLIIYKDIDDNISFKLSEVKENAINSKEYDSLLNNAIS